MSEATPEATPESIARWMADRLQQQRDGRLFQRETAREITKVFGEQFTYKNKDMGGVGDGLAASDEAPSAPSPAGPLTGTHPTASARLRRRC